jgi:hypothetical protein
MGKNYKPFHCVDNFIWNKMYKFQGIILDIKREIKVRLTACA